MHGILLRALNQPFHRRTVSINPFPSFLRATGGRGDPEQMDMAAVRISEWRKLPLSLAELCIETTLRCGQSFRWRKIDDEWTTWPAHSVPRPKPVTPAPGVEPAADGPADDTENLLRHYFSLKHNATALYELWSQNDPNFRKKAPEFTGIRIMSQDAWEALIGFICSSNNNISRISQMVHKLCINYGSHIGHIEGEPFHDFPSPEALTGRDVESRLRELGFGYRAKYIAETARIVSQEKPRGWLESLTNPENPGFNADEDPKLGRATYKEAHEQLLSLTGVGPKVADCVCLMGLGWSQAVPVDTHMWQIAQRDYKFGKAKTKTFSKVMYDSVGDHFRSIWGEHAGWAQSVLFTANLKSFSERATPTTKVEEVRIKVEQEVVDAAVPRSRKRRVGDHAAVKEEPISDETRVLADTKRRRTRSSWKTEG